MATHNSPRGTTPGPEPDRADDSPDHHGESGAEGRGTAAAQGSGRQFERGTRADPDHEDSAPADAPASGPGASASGKQFARGTDSDSDGRGYGEAGREGT